MENLFIISSLASKKIGATSKDLGYFISFPFFAMKKEKKRKQRKGKHAIKMNESSETTFPNLPFPVLHKHCHPEKFKLTRKRLKLPLPAGEGWGEG